MKSKKISAFTLAEVVIVVGIIGIIAEMTIPTLVQDVQERQIVTGLMKFNSTLQSAITMWKTEVGCNSDFGTCLAYEGYIDNDPNAFLETIGKYFKITDKAIGSINSKNWLPTETLDYYGDRYTAGSYGSVANTGSGNGAFLLQDGTTFSIDTSVNLIMFYIDANGKKKPNRVGKDVFQILAGRSSSKKDIRYGSYYNFASGTNVRGLCAYGAVANNCETDNVNPTIDDGANPTMYVIMHQKLPDFKYLSTVVSGFKP